jgi:hypothetical protein
MYSAITKIYYRKPVGHAFTKPVQTEEVGCGFVDWIGLPQDRDMRRALVSAVRNLRVP